MTQKDAVFSAVTSVLADAGINFNVGNTDAGSVLTKVHRSKVNDILCERFTSGEVELSSLEEYSQAELRAYVSGLVSNWLRKDSRLNGNANKDTVVTTDPQLVALKKLKQAQSDPSKRLEIQGFIDKRTTELMTDGH